MNLANEPALLMPFAFHAHPREDGSGLYRFLKPDHLRPDLPADYLSDADLSQLEQLIAQADANPQAVAEEAIRAMAEAQYEHLDVHWRHVAFIVGIDPRTKNLKRQSVLIDLGRVERLPTNDLSSKRAAEQRMLDALG